MARYNTIQTNFLAGELSPKNRARIDTKEFTRGCETLKNKIPLKYGGETRRPGSRFFKHTSSLHAKVVPFIFSKDEVYLVGLDNLSTDTNPVVYKDDGTTATVVGLVNSQYTPFAAVSGDLGRIHYAQSGDVMVFTDSNNRKPPMMLVRTGTDVFEWMQYMNPLFNGFFHQNVPYKAANVDSGIQFYFGAAGGGTAFDWNSAYPLENMFAVNAAGSAISFFVAGHVGAIFRVTSGGNEAVVQVVSITGTGEASVRVLVDYDSTLVGVGNRTDNWQMCAWNGVDGYPGALCFYQQRLLFGGTISAPDTIWGTETGLLKRLMQTRLDQDASSEASQTNYFGPLTDNTAFDFGVSSTEVNAISWLVSANVLLIGTGGAEYAASPIDGAFGLGLVNVKTVSSYGSTDVQAFKAGRAVLYISRDSRRVRELVYNDENGSSIARDLTALNEDLAYYDPAEELDADVYVAGGVTNYAGSTFEEMAWQESLSTMWFRNSKHGLIGLTYDPGVELVAWHRHYISPYRKGDGSTVTTLTENDASSIRTENKEPLRGLCVVPNPTNTFDNLFLLVDRPRGAVSRYNLEYISAPFEHPAIGNFSTYQEDKPIYTDGTVLFEEYLESTLFVGSTGKAFDDSTVDATADTISFGMSATLDNFHGFHHAQKVEFNIVSGSGPGGLTDGGTYYVIYKGPRLLQLADSKANALAGTAVDITSTGSGVFNLKVFLADDGTTNIIEYLSGLERLYNSSYISNIPVGPADGLTLDVLGIKADGTYNYERVVVEDDALFVQLSQAYRVVYVGYMYDSVMKTMPIEAGAQFGVSRGNISRIDRLTLMFYRTYGGVIGSTDANIQTLSLETAPFTGDKFVLFPQSADRVPQVTVRSVGISPMTLLGIGMRGVAYDG